MPAMVELRLLAHLFGSAMIHVDDLALTRCTDAAFGRPARFHVDDLALTRCLDAAFGRPAC